jgi:DNA-directed RNA polymerase specialized sigma24 family protein
MVGDHFEADDIVPETALKAFMHFTEFRGEAKSAFSIVQTVCRNVKRWQEGDQIERWVGSGLIVAEQ